MDKKLLDSLSNLSLALEGIAAALKDKSEAQSATAKAMKDGDFVKLLFFEFFTPGLEKVEDPIKKEEIKNFISSFSLGGKNEA